MRIGKSKQWELLNHLPTLNLHCHENVTIMKCNQLFHFSRGQTWTKPIQQKAHFSTERNQFFIYMFNIVPFSREFIIQYMKEIRFH